MTRATDFHTGAAEVDGAAKAWVSVTIRLSPDDRATLVRLTHARKKNASDVVRELLRAADSATEAP